LVCPPPGADRISIRRRGRVLPDRRRHPLSLLSLGRRKPRVECAKWSTMRGHPSRCSGASTSVF
jgi:hypothetical protein